MALIIDNVLNSIASSNGVLTVTGTGALTVAKGTTSQRPGSPQTGMLRFNTTTDDLEVYKSGGWASTSGGGGVSSADAIAFAIVFGS